MAKERVNKRKGDPVSSLKKQVRKAAGGSESGDNFWIRDDGALCWGNECVVLNPNENGNIAVQINKNKGCDVSAFADAIAKTIAKGGETVFRIKDD